MLQKRDFSFLIPMILVVLISQCSAGPNHQVHAENMTVMQGGDTSLQSLNYNEMKNIAEQKRKAWKKELDQCPAASQKAFLSEKGLNLHTFFIDSVLPCWYGTHWDFNGYTDIPRTGVVACGYFVSTPLKHMGFNLNRFKVAQQYSHSIVNTLCSDIRDLQGFDKVKSHLQTCSNGLYIVGLDNHVGFISVEKTGIYFIHSSYVDPACVMKENIDDSAVFQYSKRFVVGSFTGNQAIILKWLKNEAIQIVP